MIGVSTSSPSAASLSSQLDSQNELTARMEALAELMRSSQLRINDYFRHHGIVDHDVLDDLSGETWLIITKKIESGGYINHGNEAIAFCYGVARLVLLNHFKSDKRTIGQVVTLTEDFEVVSTQAAEMLENIEQEFDVQFRFQKLMSRLTCETMRDIAKLWWRHQTASQIATDLCLNIKTVRKKLQQIAEELRSIYFEELSAEMQRIYQPSPVN